MLKLLLSFFNPIEAIVKEISSLKIARLQAETNEKKLEYDERIATLEAKRDIILKAQSDKYERWVRIGFSVPFIVYLWKLLIWDKVITSNWWPNGSTDDLTSNQWMVFLIVLGGYFLDTTIKRFKK